MPMRLNVWGIFELQDTKTGDTASLMADLPLCHLDTVEPTEEDLRSICAEEHTVNGWIEGVVESLNHQIEAQLVRWHGR